MKMKEEKKTSLCHLLKSQFLIPIPTMNHKNAALKSNPQQTQSTQSKTLTPNSQSAAPLSKQPLAQRSIQTRSEPRTCYNTKTTLGRNTI